MRVSIKGQQQAQRAMMKMIAAVKPTGSMGRAVLYMATDAHRYLVTVTHVDTGAYKSSQFMRPEGTARYRLYVDPSARNPRSGNRPADYSIAEEIRGGSHAAYNRTYQRGPTFAGRAAAYLIRELP